MELQHLSVKVYSLAPSAPEVADAIPVFHRWIQEKALPGLWLDVADYSHVPAGPGIQLIGHEAYIRLEQGAEERLGIVFEVREIRDGDNHARLLHALGFAFRAALLLSAAPEFAGRLSFDAGQLLVCAGDRLLARNNAEHAAVFRQELEGALKVLGIASVETKVASTDSRSRLTLSVACGAPVALDEVLSALR